MSFILPVIYGIAAVVIGGIAWLINQFYAMIIILANVDLFEQFSDIKDKIFALMGLFMVFKISLSVIQYVINPDKLTDSSTGAQKILIKVVISLALLGSYNAIFDTAMRIQNLVLGAEGKNVLLELVFGGSGEAAKKELDSEGYSEDENGRYLSFAIFSPFIKYNMKAFDDELDNCDASPFVKRTEAGASFDVDIVSLFSGDECFEKTLEMISSKNQTRFKDGLKELKLNKAIMAIASAKRNKEACFEIDWLMAPIVGLICAVILVIICINIVIRTLKLSLLRLIAPIPIISYIDPNDKEGLFKKWLNMTIKTYLDLFIRLLSFYFSIFVITKIIAKPGELVSGITFAEHPLLFIFFMVGTLLFALQLPKIISDLTGANTEGLGKGMRKGASMLGAAGLGFVGGAATGAAAGISNIRQNGLSWRNVGGTLGNMLTGSAGSMLRGGFNARNGGNAITHAVSGITQTSTVRNANAIVDRSGRRVRSGVPFASSIAHSFGTMAGLRDATGGARRLREDARGYQEALNVTQNDIQDATTRRANHSAALVAAQTDQANSQTVLQDFARSAGITTPIESMNEVDFANLLRTWRSSANSAGVANVAGSTATLVELDNLEHAYHRMIDANRRIADAQAGISTETNEINRLRTVAQNTQREIDATRRNQDTLRNSNGNRR